LAQTHSFIYAVLKPWVRLGARLFFRKIKFDGIENLRLDRPIILVANHQNAMLDPLMVCLASQRQLHWLTRADIFKKPSVHKLLRKINMLPVYRERDRVADLSNKNQETFEECFARLKEHAIICIFPEGTHRGKKQLVPLKKGTARMVLGAVDAGIEHLCIVPVGLDYENYYAYRKNLLVKCGNPIEVNIPANQSNFDRARSQSELTTHIRDAISNVMINIEREEVYDEIMYLRPLCDSISGSKNISKQFDFFKSISEKLQSDISSHAFLKKEVKEYHSVMHQLKLREELYRDSFSWMSLFIVVIGLPCAMVSGLVFYPIYALTERFVAVVVKDPLFKNSIRLCFWTFLTPVWLLILFAIAYFSLCSSLMAVVVIMSVLVCGLISLKWKDSMELFLMQLKCNNYTSRKNAKFTAWKTNRESIIRFIHQLK